MHPPHNHSGNQQTCQDCPVTWNTINSLATNAVKTGFEYWSVTDGFSDVSLNTTRVLQSESRRVENSNASSEHIS